MDCGLMSLAGWLDGCLDGVGRTDVSSETWLREFKAATPAVPVVHPEPAPESSDSVAELVAGTTRSGDRAVPLVDHAYVEGPYAYCHKCGNHRNAHPALEEL